MPTIRVSTDIGAPPERCFDLARSVDAHVGWLAERLFLTAYLTRFLQRRAQVLKRLAESEEWRRFIKAG